MQKRHMLRKKFIADARVRRCNDTVTTLARDVLYEWAMMTKTKTATEIKAELEIIASLVTKMSKDELLAQAPQWCRKYSKKDLETYFIAVHMQAWEVRS